MLNERTDNIGGEPCVVALRALFIAKVKFFSTAGQVETWLGMYRISGLYSISSTRPDIRLAGYLEPDKPDILNIQLINKFLLQYWEINWGK